MIKLAEGGVSFFFFLGVGSHKRGWVFFLDLNRHGHGKKGGEG